MNTAMQWHLQHGLTRIQSECRTAITRIAHERRISTIVRLSQVTVRPEFRVLAKRDVQALHQAAHNRISTLLNEKTHSDPTAEAYRVLCGHFPDLAHKARELIRRSASQLKAEATSKVI